MLRKFIFNNNFLSGEILSVVLFCDIVDVYVCHKSESIKLLDDQYTLLKFI